MVNGKDPERGEIWWAELPEPRGSEPGYRRPVLVIQSDLFNSSRIPTIIVAIVSSNLKLADLPGNVLITRRPSNLPRDSVVNVSQLLSIDRGLLGDFIGILPGRVLALVDDGLRLALGI
jgi:mRNA interferase MazF